jgi:hypothetical protein
MFPFYRKAMSDLPLDKENQRRNVSRTPGLPSIKKVVVDQGTATSTVARTSTTPSTPNTANDAATFAARRSPPGSSKVLRKRWEIQFEKEQAEKRLQQQQQPRLMERGAVRLSTSSPVPMTMHTSNLGDVVMRNSSRNSNSSNNSPILGADLHNVNADADADQVNTSGDSDQSLGFSIGPVSARKDCTNPVAMTLLNSDDGMEDVTFLLEHDCTHSTTVTPSKGSSGSRQSPLTCSARVPVQNIARPVAARPKLSQHEQKQQYYQDDHHQQYHQQQYYYQQQQAQQQEQQYYQQQQQHPYHQQYQF